MDLVGSGFSAVLSSSCMPFLKALMPCATSPIRSEILPRPNNSRTTAITTIQCQMLSEPILQPSKKRRPASGQALAEGRPERYQKQGPRPRHIAVTATYYCYSLTQHAQRASEAFGTSFRCPLQARRPAPAEVPDCRLHPADLHPRAGLHRQMASER